jgi:hypothetical protein
MPPDVQFLEDSLKRHIPEICFFNPTKLFIDLWTDLCRHNQSHHYDLILCFSLNCTIFINKIVFLIFLYTYFIVTFTNCVILTAITNVFCFYTPATR